MLDADLSKPWQLRSGLLAAALLAPLLFPLLVMLAWLAAWVQLGHVPRSSLDDPKHIGGPATWLFFAGFITVNGLLIWPAVAAVAAGLWAAGLTRLRDRVGGFLLCMLLLALVYAAIWAWTEWDPGHVLYWWFD